MQKLGEAGYVLTSREFAFLAALTGAENIYGIEDDTYALSQEALKQEWDKVKGQLEHKKYIEVEIDNSITVDEDLYALIVHCCQPAMFIKCERKGIGNKRISRNFYITREIAVELDEDHLMKRKYALTPLTTPDKVKDNLFECYQNIDGYEIADTTIKMPYKTFQEILALIEDSGQDDVVQRLIAAGCDNEKAMDLYQALETKDNYMFTSVLQFLPHSDVQMSSFSLFGGEKYLWQSNFIESEEEDVCFHIRDNTSVLEEVDALVAEINKIYRRW
ncbi:hypothetical protein HZI73_23560 [Vallitalea pronyensis]|uniref:Uncharacterized protein n=1 Tax=Vallitalea pronyensis TaxID=1348613 RepID=A0A8J8MP65_9FIRM|nr:hypothetical protein [Vallitalea pronyensis]QUI25089.1 hypothetical protein HZI73_23560 [Vallitalea pronyensis]